MLRDEVGRLTVLMEELLEYGKPFKGDFYKLSVDDVVASRCGPVYQLRKLHK